MTPPRPWIGPTEALLLRRAAEKLGDAATARAMGYAEVLAALDGTDPRLVHLAEGLQYAAVGPIAEVLGQAWTEHLERCHEHGLDPDRPYHHASELARLTALLELEAPVLEEDLVRVERGALFSDCRTYRYKLWRIWDEDGPKLNVIGLNPSTADEEADDPTIRRCVGFARDWGFGGLVMTNLFALRSTDPRGLLAVEDPVGPENDRHLEIAACSGSPLAAWGAHPLAVNRSAAVMRTLHYVEVECLGLTKGGAPRHPLYVPKITQRVRFGAAS